MRASLVSATSLLALLLVDGELAHATPSLTASTQTVNFGNVLVSGSAATVSDTISISNGYVSGTGGYNSSFTASAATGPFHTSISGQTVNSASQTVVAEGFTFLPTITGVPSASVVTATDSVSAGSVSSILITLTGTGVAPIGALSSSSTNYFLVNGTVNGGSGTGQTAIATVVNSGNGNLSGTTTNAAGTISNFRGTIGSGTTSATTGFKGTAASISLGDSSSTTYSYTFTPTVKAQTASTLVIATLSNGSANGQNTGFNSTLTLTGTGVAPVEKVSNSGVTSIRAGTSATTAITVQNTGNGNLATGGPSSASNLNGSISSYSTIAGLSGPGVGATLSLADTSSTVFTYNYSPTSRTGGTLSALVSLAFSDGSSNLSNTAQSVTSTLMAQAVGPVFTNVKYGTSGSGTSVGGTLTTILTPTAAPLGSVGASGATISFGTVGYKQSETLYLLLQNTTNDPTIAGGSTTNLTIDKYSITGKSAYEFSSNFTPGTAITEGGQILLPITLVSSGGGALSSTLTVFTDESAALGGTGDTFTYTLTAFAVPEPATIAVLGAGLAGLAGIRRRRKPAPAL